MLEQLLIFTTGGLILWTCKELANELRGSPIHTWIRSCFLDERAGPVSFNYDTPGAAYTLKCTFHNELGIVFVAVYQRIFDLLYLDDLLAMVKRQFTEIYDPKRMKYDDFDETFRQLRKEAEARTEELERSKQISKPLDNKKKGLQGQKSGLEGGSPKNSDGGDGDSTRSREFENGQSNVNVNMTAGEGSSSSVKAFDVDKLKQRNKGVKKNDTLVNTYPNVDTKKKRVMNEESNLDYSTPVCENGNHDHVEVVAANQGESMMDREEIVSSDDEPEEIVSSDEEPEEIVSSDEEPEEIVSSDDEPQGEENVGNSSSNPDPNNGKGSNPDPNKKTWFTSMFQSIAGKKNLEKEDLEPALNALKDRLMTKNVAEEIAEKLCESVAASLEGKKLSSFRGIYSTVQAAMEGAIVRILTPTRSIDIMRDVQTAKEQKKPYVVVFVGVNGVGKSTNLSKVAYWLLQHDVSVMMAACDTFRSGAVEQLRTHARRLQIPIFEKGYEKDPAIVAKEAIQEATRTGVEVVLVDTAGRMQDNEPLMRALSKLVYINKPDLVLFVGEALVGNGAVDQLSKFNQKLCDLSSSSNPQFIDGILLTKFDTIDDKVGAALSMVYISGAPIMFVGCGQTYTDLKKLNVKSIVKTLLN